ncbi:hypothetical protein [Clostridium sp. Cult2]|uniref:hypothetical protein n=1 Tax=Clostridium sp. Cult2 TaxID=2079003 RepID=UPI001F2E8006|nr:hypothetical protein [Clostridium sp. Cult2]MCF6465672.1 hypothetical protein [Clostridium sp. Cult2]
MKNFLINDNLIINSEGEFILFCLDNQGEVKYTKYAFPNKTMETSILHKNNILKYSVTIDENDSIHLIALTKLGELNYSIYKDNRWSNAIIAKFDFKSNIYNDINILLEGNNVNIIYNHANLINSKLWTIQHVIGDRQSWDKHKIVSLMVDKTFAYFQLDIDSFGSIHLLYSSFEGNGHQVYHTFYNSYAKKWNPIPKKLSSPNTNTLFPYLFVDTKDNLHAIWLEKLNMNNTLKYCRLTSKGNEKYIWKQIKIPYISDCNNMPIIIEEKGVLKIVYLTNKVIGFLYSSDSGTTWYKGDEIEINPSKISLVRVSENSMKLKHIKINHAYCTIEQSIYFYFLSSINSIDVMEIDNPPEDHTISQVDIIGSDEEIISKVNKLLETQEEIRNILYKAIDSQNRIEENIESIFKILDVDKSSIFDKLFRSSK